MTMSQILESMWMRVFDNSLISAFAILAIFAYLCFKKRLGMTETIMVIFPVLIGVSTVGCFGTTASGCVPVYISGTVIMGMGLLWGIALTKLLPGIDPFVKYYALFLCMSASLALYGYPMGAYQNSNSLTTSTNLNGLPITDTSFITTLLSNPIAFFFGGTIYGFLIAAGVPITIVAIISVALTTIGGLLLLPTIIAFSNLILNGVGKIFGH